MRFTPTSEQRSPASTPTNATRCNPGTPHDLDLPGAHAPSPRSPRGRQALWTRASPRPRLPRPSPLPPTARDSTRASCTRAPSKQKQKRPAGRAAGARGGGGERARPRRHCPAPRPRLRRSGRRRPRAPAGRGREGRGRHPVYSPRSGPGTPPGNGLPGEGCEVRTHPRPGRRPSGEGARLRPPLGIKPSPRLRGRARTSLRSSAPPRPPAHWCVVSAPRHDCATHFTPISGLQRFHRPPRPPSRGRRLPARQSPATRAADPRALRDPVPAPTPWDATPVGPPSPHSARGRGWWPQAVRCLVFHMTKLTLTLKHPHSPFSLASS